MFITLAVSFEAAAQTDMDDPDESGPAMPNVGIMADKPITEVVEGSGTVRHSGVSVRERPDINSKVLRTASQSEKVLIIGESGDWLKVKMYNNQEGWISRRYVRTERIFRDESTTTNSMDKKTSFEIEDLIVRFNETLKESPFAAKYQIIPMLRLADARKSGGVMTLTFIYSCVDLEGRMLPSYKKNQLRPQMKRLLELIFAKLMLTDTEVFRIVINVPDFSPEGRVLDTAKPYAEIRINHADVAMDEIKDDGGRIWKYAESTVPVDELFSAFPVG